MSETPKKEPFENHLNRLLQQAENQNEDLKTVDIHIERLAQRVLMGSVVAYLVFAALCITAAYLWVDIATGQHKAETQSLKRKLSLTEKELKRTKSQTTLKRTTARERSEKIAKYFEWHLNGDYEKVFKKGQAIANLAQTPLERRVTRHVTSEAKRHASFQAYAEGVAAYNKGKTKQAIQSLKRAMKYDKTGPHITALRYYLGLAHYKQSNYRKATVYLEALLRSKNKIDVLDDHALYRLGHAHELLKQNAQAKRHYQRLLKIFPKSQYASIVKPKIKQL